MADYILEGPKWGSAPFGAGSGTVYWSFADLANGHGFYAWDASITGQFRTEVEQAFSRWQSVANIRFVEVADSSSVNIRLGFDAIDGTGGIAGETQYTFGSDSRFQAAEIRFDNNEGWHLQGGAEIGSLNSSFFALALHEIGHALGLGHYDVWPAVMNSTLTASITDLTQSDRDGISAVYGLPATTTVNSVSIGDASTAEGNSGTKTLTFTVTRSGGTAAFSVDYTAANGTATAGQDYVAGSGKLPFDANETTKTISITINGDTMVEPDEYFSVNLSNATNGATIDDNQGIGAIKNDDAGNGNDTLTGTNGDDALNGLAGNDVLYGLAGNDTLFGGPGNDTAYGGGGNDSITDDSGASSELNGEAGNDTIYGGAGDDYITGGEGDDIVGGGTDGQDSLYGGAGSDYIVAADADNNGVGSVLDGGAGANQLYALVGKGNDYAVGGEGTDIIATGAGSDYIFGNGGNDTIVAGTGTDYIYGNAGDDFIYTDDLVTNSTDYVYVSGLSGFGTGIDTVADFTPGAGGDVAVIVGTPGLTTFAQAQAKMTDAGVYTVISLSATDQLYLYNVDPGQLTADHFLFL